MPGPDTCCSRSPHDASTRQHKSTIERNRNARVAPRHPAMHGSGTACKVCANRAQKHAASQRNKGGAPIQACKEDGAERGATRWRRHRAAAGIDLFSFLDVWADLARVGVELQDASASTCHRARAHTTRMARLLKRSCMLRVQATHGGRQFNLPRARTAPRAIRAL